MIIEISSTAQTLLIMQSTVVQIAYLVLDGDDRSILLECEWTLYTVSVNREMRTRCITQLESTLIRMIGILVIAIQTEVFSEYPSQRINRSYTLVFHCPSGLVILVIKTGFEGQLIRPILIVLQAGTKDVLLVFIGDLTRRNRHNDIIPSYQTDLLSGFFHIVHHRGGYIIAERFVLMVFLFIERPHQLRLPFGA